MTGWNKQVFRCGGSGYILFSKGNKTFVCAKVSDNMTNNMKIKIEEIWDWPIRLHGLFLIIRPPKGFDPRMVEYVGATIPSDSGNKILDTIANIGESLSINSILNISYDRQIRKHVTSEWLKAVMGLP